MYRSDLLYLFTLARATADSLLSAAVLVTGALWLPAAILTLTACVARVAL